MRYMAFKFAGSNESLDYARSMLAHPTCPVVVCDQREVAGDRTTVELSRIISMLGQYERTPEMAQRSGMILEDCRDKLAELVIAGLGEDPAHLHESPEHQLKGQLDIYGGEW